MDRRIESLRVRGSGLGDAQGANRVPVSLQACKAKGTIATGAVLQNLARCHFCENKRLGTQRREILRREFSRSDGRVRCVFVASRCAAVTRHGTTRRIFVRRIDFAAESSRTRSAGSRLRIVIRNRGFSL